jgi:hypothetical protein
MHDTALLRFSRGNVLLHVGQLAQQQQREEGRAQREQREGGDQLQSEALPE